jgi:4-carboxymuconolactone decarboxylase
MSDPSKPRIEPILPPEWGKEAYDAMSVLPHGRDNILEGSKKGQPVLGSNMVCTVLNHPELAKAFLTFNSHFFYSTKLSARAREILIMRIAWLRRAEAEFSAHVAIGKRLGITDAEVEMIQSGPDAPGWSAAEAGLVRAVDELKKDARIGEKTWALLSQEFDPQQMIELVFIVGCYETLAMAFNSFQIQLEPGAPTLDPAARARMLSS